MTDLRVEPLVQQFQRTMEETFGDVLHRRTVKKNYIKSKIGSLNLIAEGPALWIRGMGYHAILRASIKGWCIPALCGRINLTEADFIGWCSLARTVLDRSYEAPVEAGMSGIYRVARGLHLRTRDGNLFLPSGRLVAIFNSHLLCDLESSYVHMGRIGDESEPWIGALDVPHPNRCPDYWHEVGYGHPRRMGGYNTPTLEVLHDIGELEREYDGDFLMKKNIPEAWHIWDSEDEADII